MDVIVEYISANYIWILLGLIIILLAIIGWYADKTNFGQGKKDLSSTEDSNLEESFDIETFNKEMKEKKMLDQVDNNIKQDNNIVSNNIENQVINPATITNVNSEPNLIPMSGFAQPVETLNNSNLVTFSAPVNEVVTNSEMNLSINNTSANTEINTDSTVSNVETNVIPTTVNTVENNNIGTVQYDSDDVYSVQRDLTKIASSNSVNTQSTIIEKEQNIEEIPQIETEQKEKMEINSDNFEEKFNDIIPEKDIMDESLLEDIDNLTLDKTQKLDLSDIPNLDDVDLPRIKQMKTNDEGIWKF